MKLELKHIVGYLPYGLKMTRNGKNFGILYALNNRYNKAEINFEFGNDRYDIEDLKPALRPMSDLHKEINGVAHIHKIGKILHDCEDWEQFDSHDNIYKGVGYEQRGLDDSEYFELVWNPGVKWFGVDYPISEHENPFKVRSSFCYLSNFSQDVLDYLYQHHFDLHNLIEQGLAIDINTLQL